jgi:Kdo2-lipid IVA lauroyltransferase/acyltransferase
VDVVEPALGMRASAARRPDTRLRVLRHRLEYAAVRLGVGFVRLLPMRWAIAAGAALGRSVGPRRRQHRRALQNLARAFPEKSTDEVETIARLMWANMGRVMVETMLIDRIVADPRRLVVSDHEHWAARISQPGPAIGATLHMGNWELAIWPLSLFGRSPAGVYRPLANPYVDRWLRAQRTSLYPGGLFGKGDTDEPERGGQRTAKLMIDHVRRGGCMGFVCDHNDRRGVVISFLGGQARFTHVPAMVARHVDARIWVGRCLRTSNEPRFRMDITELALPRTGDRTGDIQAVTAAIFAQFEAWIREHPEQWMWWNTRWIKN